MTPFRNITKNHRLGFIGLGHLGSPMARRLLAAGFPMVVYNRDTNKTTELSTLGAEVARDPAELAAQVDVVLSCVPDGAAVENVYLGPGGSRRPVGPQCVNHPADRDHVICFKQKQPENRLLARSHDRGRCPVNDDFNRP